MDSFRKYIDRDAYGQAPNTLATESVRKIMNQIKMGKYSIYGVVEICRAISQQKKKSKTKKPKQKK